MTLVRIKITIMLLYDKTLNKIFIEYLCEEYLTTIRSYIGLHIP